jgi:hypothetical protein
LSTGPRSGSASPGEGAAANGATSIDALASGVPSAPSNFSS